MEMSYGRHMQDNPSSPSYGSYEAKINDVKRKISELPAHTAREIEWTARRLEMQHVRFEMGAVDINLFRMTASDLLDCITSIESWTIAQAIANRNFEPEYSGGDMGEYVRRVKLGLIEFLYGKFVFLSRLRSDEPEAWDVIYETYYND